MHWLELVQPLEHFPPLQICAPPQLVPFASAVQSLAFEAGWQVWQTFAGFAVPLAYETFAMMQPATHAPLTQALPDSHCAPLVHTVGHFAEVPSQR